MHCEGCRHWITSEKTIYADGSMIVTRESGPGDGRCRMLMIDTAMDFGCNRFEAGAEHVALTRKNGAPWHHFVMIDCPDCRGQGSSGGACNRCAGTAKVRQYDDGYVGEERTRMHPKEKEAGAGPKCQNCQRDADIAWVACPHCGHRLMPVAKTEVVGDPLGTGGAL